MIHTEWRADMRKRDILSRVRKEFEREKKTNNTLSRKRTEYNQYYIELENLRNKYNYRELESVLNVAQNDLDVIMTRKVRLYCFYIGNILKTFLDNDFNKDKVAKTFADNGINVSLHNFNTNDFLDFVEHMDISDYDIVDNEVVVGYDYPIYISKNIFNDIDYLKKLDKEFAKL